jgi:hypothetical protein
VCLFWNYDDFDEKLDGIVEGVFAGVVPEAVEAPQAGDKNLHERTLRSTGCFASIEVRDYRWTETLPVEEWVARVSTHSKQLLLGPQRLAQLQAALSDALHAEYGDTLQLRNGTHALWARP